MQVPTQEGLGNTWVKVKEQFRLTMEGKCRFVVVLDADIMFPDLRLPFEALLSHWNITSDIAVAGALDIPSAKDRFGKLVINTGLIITQNTPQLPTLMRDWIDCPTDVKYKGCSHWAKRWGHEQSALSEYIRYDYADVIREIETMDVHSPRGKFTKHYWGQQKKHLEEAAKKAIWNAFLPTASQALVHGWLDHFEQIKSAKAYDFLMEPAEPVVAPPTAN